MLQRVVATSIPSCVVKFSSRPSAYHRAGGGRGSGGRTLLAKGVTQSKAVAMRGGRLCICGGGLFEDQDVTEPANEPDAEPALPPGLLFMNSTAENLVRVVEIPADSGAALAGARLLMLDHTNNVHSIFQPDNESMLSTAYWDVMCCLPPLLPAEGILGWLGLGAGTGALITNRYFPGQRQAGWEIDEVVLEASRRFMGLDVLEACSNPIQVHVEDAFEASIEGGFSGLIVDLFSHGRLLRPLLEANTWESLANKLQSGGYLMANLGGSAGADQMLDDDAKAALVALRTGVPEDWMVYVKNMEGMSCNTLAIAGRPLDIEQWRAQLPDCLASGVDGWMEAEIGEPEEQPTV